MLTEDPRGPRYNPLHRSNTAFDLPRVTPYPLSRIIYFALTWQSFFLAGCGDVVPLGVVSGTVRYRGATVTEGTVSLYSPDLGTGGEAAINADGSFSVGGLRFGPYRIAIHPPLIHEDFGGKSAPSMEPKQVNNIPNTYRNPSTSGFACDVVRRNVEIDLNME